MKKYSKLITFVCVLVLLLSSMVLPSLAAPVDTGEIATDVVTEADKKVPAAQKETLNNLTAEEILGGTIVTGASNESIVMESDNGSKVILVLGEEYAGRHFALETDAGMDPDIKTVAKDGTLELEIPYDGSSRYALTLIKQDTGTAEVTTMEATEEVTESESGKEEKEEKKTDTKLIIMFGVILALAVTYLVLSKVRPMKKKQEKPVQNSNGDSVYDDDEEM